MKNYENVFCLKENGHPIIFYDEHGVLISQSLRFLPNHPNEYWDNYFKSFKFDFDLNNYFENLKEDDSVEYHYIDELFFIGGITNHIGHFIMESLPRISEYLTMPTETPFTGWVGQAIVPDGIVTCKKEEIESLLPFLNSELNVSMKNEGIYRIKKLYLPELPIVLSKNCERPWQMKNILKLICELAVVRYPMDEIEHLHLVRFGENIEGKKCTLSNPEFPLLEQISMIHHAKKLTGQVGSNTHLCVFSKYDTVTEWTRRDRDNSGHYIESYRNQAICDLVKT